MNQTSISSSEASEASTRDVDTEDVATKHSTFAEIVEELENHRGRFQSLFPQALESDPPVLLAPDERNVHDAEALRTGHRRPSNHADRNYASKFIVYLVTATLQPVITCASRSEFGDLCVHISKALTVLDKYLNDDDPDADRMYDHSGDSNNDRSNVVAKPRRKLRLGAAD